MCGTFDTESTSDWSRAPAVYEPSSAPGAPRSPYRREGQPCSRRKRAGLHLRSHRSSHPHVTDPAGVSRRLVGSSRPAVAVSGSAWSQ
eukprot:2935155-Pyramimonas_sp.AAC.1